MRSQLPKQTAKGARDVSRRAAPARKGSQPQRPDTAIPDKLYFRIGEVARLCAVQTYVLRFWESEFPQLKPSKSGTGQRLYRKRDVEMALRIRRLLYDEGYTIPGARQAFLLEAKASAGSAQKQPELPLGSTGNKPSPLKVQRLKNELREILGLLSTPPGKPRLVKKEQKREVPPQLFSE